MEVGRLTLRQFYLLLAEWYQEQARQDRRFYLLMLGQYKEPPDVNAIFPLLKSSDADAEELEDPTSEDDFLKFQQITSSLISRQG